MDSLSQIALGAAVGYAVLGKRLRSKALVYGALLGTFPDLDVLIPFGGPVENFTFHRGASHSLLVHALLSVPFAMLLRKRHPEIRPVLAYLFVLAILATHALLDAFTIYGTQLFWPFAPTPAALGSIFIIDPLYTLPLLISCLNAWRSRDSTKGRKAIHLGLGISTAYLAFGVLTQRTMIQTAEASLRSQGLQPERILATPTPFNALLWRIVAIDGDRYHEGLDSILDGQGPTWRSIDRNPQYASAIDSKWEFPRLDWFTSGFWALRRDDDELIWEDLRMGSSEAYVFRYRLGRFENGKVFPAPAERRSQPIDASLLPFLWRRLWSADAKLTR